MRARYLIRDDGIVNLAYRYRRGDSPSRPTSRSCTRSTTPGAWSAGYYYSILDNKPLEQIAGVQWDSCCLAVRLVARRYLAIARAT